MIYLDNAATARYMPKTVIQAYVDQCNKKSNPGRGGHSESIRAGLAVYHAREKLNAFFNNVGGECVFTKNCTEALNTALFGTAKKGHIVCTVTEHNSVLRAVNHLQATRQATVSYAKPNAQGVVTWDKIEPLLHADTYLIVVNCVSNVTGIANAYEEIFRRAGEKGLLTLADAAQAAGHVRLDMNAMGCDMLATAGHKGLYGMQGTGALLFSGRVRVRPLLYGGTGTDGLSIRQPTNYPEGLEAGTLNTAGIAALGAAVDWVDKRLEIIAKKNEEYTSFLSKELSAMKEYIVFSSANPSGIFSFLKKGTDSETLADYLNECGIAVRGGLHCAPLMHRYMDTLSTGTVRVSMGYDTKEKELDVLLKALSRY